ncbi:uncharacterized protein LOC125939944 [Dermacentor silvarum]|uniref:uncharacterized protein LOC125939944 n=1 Tax=Dermacentor silvarum TaxID=543639 RepID=UPI002101AC34|nr:uncharacterized protein LOC125939944 [Dermacentor silvarum]
MWVHGIGYQVGIVSFGQGCARPNGTSLHTKLHFYLPWIASEIASRRGKHVIDPSDTENQRAAPPSDENTTSHATAANGTIEQAVSTVSRETFLASTTRIGKVHSLVTPSSGLNDSYTVTPTSRQVGRSTATLLSKATPKFIKLTSTAESTSTSITRNATNAPKFEFL